MFDHERFRELSAIGSIGQLSPDEDRELNEHLRECSECRRLLEEYSRIILHESLPAEEIQWPSRATGSRFTSDEELLDRFLDRASAEGIQLSRDGGPPRVLRTSSLTRAWLWKAAAIAAILALAALAGISLGHVFRIRNSFLGTPPCQNCLSTPSAK